MKTNSTQREILLITNNSFAQREWCSREITHEKSMTSQEQMEEVCANGLIYEILPEIFKTPFQLYFDGYKYQEIADVLNEPLGTVKSRIHFARKLLKDRLTRY